MNSEYEYFMHTIKFLFLRLTLKYLALGMTEEAIYLALKTNQPEIQAVCRSHAQMNNDIVAINLLEFHDQNQNEQQLPRQVGWVKSLTQIANFTKKVLKKEDYLNLFKDFDTLLKIDHINDLELSDFNGWEFDLEAY